MWILGLEGLKNLGRESRDGSGQFLRERGPNFCSLLEPSGSHPIISSVPCRYLLFSSIVKYTYDPSVVTKLVAQKIVIKILKRFSIITLITIENIAL